MFGLDHITRALKIEPSGAEASPTGARRAAVAMILRERPGRGAEALFIRRAEHPRDPWSGQMAFPGGHQDAADATPLDAAIRETREEVGLALTPAMRVGRLADVTGSRIRPGQLWVTPFVFAHSPQAELRLNHEVAGAVWVPLAWMADPANLAGYVHPADPLGRRFPAFHFEGEYMIWGMTFRIIGHFFERFGIELPPDPPISGVEP